MNITIKSLISDLEKLARNNSDAALLAGSILDNYRDELPDVARSVVQLIDAKYQTAAKNIMQGIDWENNVKCRFRGLIRSAPFFELTTIDLSKMNDDTGNDAYLFTVAADNSGSRVKARVECKFYLCIRRINELARAQAGVNRTCPFVVSLSLTIGEELPSSVSLIDVSDCCSVT